MFFGYLFELGLLLVGIWVLANMARAVAYKSSRGGGFWGLSNWIMKVDLQKQREQEIKDEVEKRLAAIVAAAEAKGGEQGK